MKHIVVAETINELTLSPEEVKELLSVLHESNDFFTRRDQMNGAVHCSPVRWSPLTEKVRNVLNKINAHIVEEFEGQGEAGNVLDQ